MFTGIVQQLGEIVSLDRKGKEAILAISVPARVKSRAGESLAVNGVCLTVKKRKKSVIFCDCLPETLRVTTIGSAKIGELVNLEKSATLQTLLGGHLVCGHVDGVGTVISGKKTAHSKTLKIRAPKNLSRYFVSKGSVAVDGVSLTILEIFSDGFSVSLIPTTLSWTTLGRKNLGDKVNLEVDLFAKYCAEFIKRSRGQPT